MAAKPIPSLDEVATRDLCKLAAFMTTGCAVLLVCSFQILGKLEWPGLVVWGCRAFAAGAVAALWHETAWLMLREVWRRRNRGPGADPDAGR